MPVLAVDDFWSELLNKSGAAIAVAVVSAVASFTLGRWWGRYRARKQWESKEFLGRIIVSLNTIRDGRLKLRTIFERSLEEVFLNPHAVEQVLSAAQRTTKDNPILPIAKEDRWFFLNFVLNAVAEHFSDGLLRYDAGQPLRPVTYLLFLTCEVVGEDRIRKVRAMLLRKDHMEDFPYWEDLPKLERDWHSDRVATLRRAAELYRKEPDHFLPVEIYV